MKSAENLPPSLRPKYDKSCPGLVAFRTRKDAVYHAWYVMNRPDVNLFKEGPYYACQIGKTIYATGWRNLGFSVETFEKCITEQYFPF